MKMPPKARLNKKSGKSGIAPLQVVASTSSSDPPQRLSKEAEEQFEIELCWCIQQLQRSINSEKLNEKQLQESTKALNTLMGNSAPLIKKRQLMRLTFGDYRTKMQEEVKKQSKLAASIRIAKAQPSKSSVFLKKSAFSSSDNNFKFNFDVDKVASSLPNDISRVDIQASEPKPNSYHYAPSDNSFKFNFSSNKSS